MSKDAISPPAWADRMLCWFCADEHLEVLQGDLHELFEYRYATKGRFLARLHYIKDAFDMLRPFALKKRKSKLRRSQMDMFRNHLKVAFRNIYKHREYQAINLIGLCISITTCLIIWTYVSYELSYDKHYTNYDELYRIKKVSGTAEQELRSAIISGEIAPALASRYNDIGISRVFRNSFYDAVVVQEENSFIESEFYRVDSTFFQVFGLELEVGDANTALAEPNSLVITERIAKKYFGSQNPIGQTLEVRVQGVNNYTVTGVIADPPRNSHFNYDFLAFRTGRMGWGWGWDTVWTYLRFPGGVDQVGFESELSGFVEEIVPEEMKEGLSLKLQAVSDIHLTSDLAYEMKANGNIKNIQNALLITLIIVLIVCVNYANINAAQFMNRAKEIGVRKVLGATRNQLTFQFLYESFILCFLSMLLSIFIANGLYPYLGWLTATDSYLKPFDMVFVQRAGILTLGIWLICGIYPAALAASLRIKHIIKGYKPSGLPNKKLVKRAFALLQFTLTGFLIFALTIVYRQLDFVQSKDLGIEVNDVMLVQVPIEIRNESFDVFMNQAMASPYVSALTKVDNAPWESRFQHDFRLASAAPDEHLSVNVMWVEDGNFPEVFGARLMEGRTLSTVQASDSINGGPAFECMVNETAAKLLGGDVLGQLARMSFGPDDGVFGHVVGVVQDFNFQSLHHSIDPLIILTGYNTGFAYVAVKFEDGNQDQGVRAIIDTWDEQIPDWPMSFTMLGQDRENLYAKDQSFFNLFLVLTALAIMVSAIGLYGIISFFLLQRLKEIGIRKVLGANAYGLLSLLTKEYVVLILLSCCIAIPTAYYVAGKWLNDFAFRTSIGLMPFMVMLLALLLIMALAAGRKSLIAINVNPVKILRSE